MSITTQQTLTSTDPSAAILEMRRQGFSVVRNALDPDQVQALRVAITTHFRHSGRMRYGGKIQLRALQAVDGLAATALSADLAEVIRAHVGHSTPLLTGECDVMMNTTSGWHKDITPDMNLGSSLFEADDFAVYKVGIYLQDQTAGSPAALRVRPGSQRCGDVATGPVVRLETHPGDVVVFDVRIDHAGQAPDLATRLLGRATRMIARLSGRDADMMLTRIRQILRRRPDRVALFMTFGPDNHWTHDYERSGRHRHGPATALRPDAMRSFQAVGIEIIAPD